MPLWRAHSRVIARNVAWRWRPSLGKGKRSLLSSNTQTVSRLAGPVVAAPGALVPQRQSRLKMPFSDLICPVGGLHAGEIWAAGLSGQ